MRIKQVSQPNNLDFMRLFFAVLVIASHSFTLTTGNESCEPLQKLSHGQISAGGIAVDAFFIISGFLITSSAERSSGLLRFLQKRVSRIYPAFICCALVTAIVFMPIASASLAAHTVTLGVGESIVQTIRLREFPYTGAFRGNPFPGEINGSIWSIQYEFWCYVGVAVLMASSFLRRRWVILAFFVFSVLISILAVRIGWQPRGSFLESVFGLTDFWARLLPLYLAGVVFYLFRDRISYTATGFGIALSTIVGSVFLLGAWALVFPVAGSYLLFYLAYVPAGRLRRFGEFGDFSYGTYLFAFPIQQVLMHLFPKLHTWQLFALATPPTLLAACISWYGVERRFLPTKHEKGVPAPSRDLAES